MNFNCNNTRRLKFSDIDFDAPYQRGIVPGHPIRREEFKPSLALYLVVADRRYPDPPNGKPFGGADGKQRAGAAQANGYLDWPCVVIPVYSYEDEASLFNGINKGRKQLTPHALFNGAKEAGDAAAKVAEELAVRHGFTIGKSKSSGTRITACQTLWDIAKKSAALLDETLVLIRKTWSADNDERTNGQFMRGISMFIEKAGDKYDFDRAVKMLGKRTPNQILTDSSKKTRTGHRQNEICEMLIYLYNGNRQKENCVMAV